VNIDAIASQLDIDAIVSRVDVDTIVYQLDVDAIVPREARSFQGHRAGLVTRLAAGAIDVGVVILALVVCYFVVFAFSICSTPATSPLRDHRQHWCMPSAPCCSFFISR